MSAMFTTKSFGTASSVVMSLGLGAVLGAKMFENLQNFSHAAASGGKKTHAKTNNEEQGETKSEMNYEDVVRAAEQGNEPAQQVFQLMQEVAAPDNKRNQLLQDLIDHKKAKLKKVKVGSAEASNLNLELEKQMEHLNKSKYTYGDAFLLSRVLAFYSVCSFCLVHLPY